MNADFQLDLSEKVNALPLSDEDKKRVIDIAFWAMAQVAQPKAPAVLCANCGMPVGQHAEDGQCTSPVKDDLSPYWRQPVAAKELPSARTFSLLNLLCDCMEYLQCDPATVGGRPEADRLVGRVREEIARGADGHGLQTTFPIASAMRLDRVLGTDGVTPCATCKWPLSPCACPAGVAPTAQTQPSLTPREVEILREIRLHAKFDGLNEGWQREARNLLLGLERFYAAGVKEVDRG